MPFNIWCGSNAEDPDPNVKGCRKHIGIGVRYNAEKTRVAMYYTTPVYQFKMRCHMCSIQSPLKRTLVTWITLWSLEAEGWNKDGIHPETDSWSPRAKVWGGSWQMTPCSSWSTSPGTRASRSRKMGRGWAGCSLSRTGSRTTTWPTASSGRSSGKLK